MHQYEMTVGLRTGTGKGTARKLRSAGQVPAVLYGGGNAAVALQLDRKAFTKLVEEGASGHLVRLRIEGDGGVRQALVKEIQLDPVRGLVRHVDFHEVRLDQPVTTTIPFHVTGEEQRPSGSGIIQHMLREAAIECLPTDIPDAIEVNVAALAVGDSITLGQLTLPNGVRFVHEDLEEVVETAVAAPRAASEEAQAAEAEGEGAGGDEPAKAEE
ncbi:MAG TPA: 50S ribosomal protein L25 [Limnochordia bacterium]|nr:50S ribosomal protein L25 [Limnochordia bacterium]